MCFSSVKSGYHLLHHFPPIYLWGICVLCTSKGLTELVLIKPFLFSNPPHLKPNSCDTSLRASSSCSPCWPQELIYIINIHKINNSRGWGRSSAQPRCGSPPPPISRHKWLFSIPGTKEKYRKSLCQNRPIPEVEWKELE